MEKRSFNPDLTSILDGEPSEGRISRYSLVTATAKLARDIAEEADLNKEILTDMPVSLALEKLLDGDYKIVEPDEIKYL